MRTSTMVKQLNTHRDNVLTLVHLMRTKVSLSGLHRSDRRTSAANQLGSLDLLNLPAFHEAYQEVYGYEQ